MNTINARPIKINDAFLKWCKLTKRSGGVLVGSSIREFFKWLEDSNYTLIEER